MKPCVAVVLDGNLGGADRHEAAFVVAIECRALGLDEAATADVLAAWARKIGYRERDATRAIRNAFAKDSRGRWQYHPPGLTKRPGTTFGRVLAPTCADVGCPQNCGPLADVYRGPQSETFEKFKRLGRPTFLRRKRLDAAVDFYGALCELEAMRGIAPGGPVRASYAQLGKAAERHPTKAGKNLDRLLVLGLLAEFEHGSGSGPYARDRSASLVRRAVPIPEPPPLSTAIKYRSPGATDIGSRGLQLVGGSELDIGSRRAVNT